MLSRFLLSAKGGMVIFISLTVFSVNASSISTYKAANAGNDVKIYNLQELVKSLHSATVKNIVLMQSVTGAESIKLPPGVTLHGLNPDINLEFEPGDDGLELTSDNTIRDITVKVSPRMRAIYNNYSTSSMGKIALENVSTIGQIQFIAKEKIRSGSIIARNINVIYADSVARPERPHSGVGYEAGKTSNIDIVQGAFTVLNLQHDPSAIVHVDIRGIDIGHKQRPVYGSGILLSSGYGNIYRHPGETQGGRLEVSMLETGNIYNDSRIRPGTADLISGSVFVAYADAENVINRGSTVSYGVNGLGLDGWGNIKYWTSIGPVTTYGDSGMGVVNFGVLQFLAVSSIETFGKGARGFNVLTGTVNNAFFGNLRTHGNGSTAILIKQPIGNISVQNDIETFGSSAGSLTAGLINNQPSSALSFVGGEVNHVFVGGEVKTRGQGSHAINIDNSTVYNLYIAGDVQALGEGSQRIFNLKGSLPSVYIKGQSVK